MLYFVVTIFFRSSSPLLSLLLLLLLLLSSWCNEYTKTLPNRLKWHKMIEVIKATHKHGYETNIDWSKNAWHKKMNGEQRQRRRRQQRKKKRRNKWEECHRARGIEQPVPTAKEESTNEQTMCAERREKSDGRTRANRRWKTSSSIIVIKRNKRLLVGSPPPLILFCSRRWFFFFSFFHTFCSIVAQWRALGCSDVIHVNSSACSFPQICGKFTVLHCILLLHMLLSSLLFISVFYL